MSRSNPAKNGTAPGVFLADDYAPISGVYDEMMDAQTGVRPHWSNFLESLGRFSGQELQDRWDTAQRLVRENG
ncbi:MAG: hypothetical protein RLO05_09220, partial [Rhodospirillales bacterium]